MRDQRAARGTQRQGRGASSVSHLSLHELDPAVLRASLARAVVGERPCRAVAGARQAGAGDAAGGDRLEDGAGELLVQRPQPDIVGVALDRELERRVLLQELDDLGDGLCRLGLQRRLGAVEADREGDAALLLEGALQRRRLERRRGEGLLLDRPDLDLAVLAVDPDPDRLAVLLEPRHRGARVGVEQSGAEEAKRGAVVLLDLGVARRLCAGLEAVGDDVFRPLRRNLGHLLLAAHREAELVERLLLRRAGGIIRHVAEEAVVGAGGRRQRQLQRLLHDGHDVDVGLLAVDLEPALLGPARELRDGVALVGVEDLRAELPQLLAVARLDVEIARGLRPLFGRVRLTAGPPLDLDALDLVVLAQRELGNVVRPHLRLGGGGIVRHRAKRRAIGRGEGGGGESELEKRPGKKCSLEAHFARCSLTRDASARALRASRTPGLYRGEPEDDAAAEREQAPPRSSLAREALGWGRGVRQRPRGPFGPSYGSEGSKGCAGRDGSILIFRREPIGAPRAVAAPTPGPGLARRRSDE